MGLLDQLNLGDLLKGVLGQTEGSAGPAALNELLAKTKFGDLNGLVTQLQQNGLGAEVQSWLGNGSNMPVSADQLKAVLGNAQVQEFANHLGIPVDQTLAMLSKFLPDAVDKASPNGTLQSS